MFTEVLLDCFRVGSIPIFWGCPNIGEYFDVDGMHVFENDDQFDDIMKIVCSDGSCVIDRSKIKLNFEESKKYIHTDDYIADILIKL